MTTTDDELRKRAEEILGKDWTMRGPMRITIDFERVPMRAVFRSELHVERVSDPLTAAAQAGAMLQLSESSNVRILSVSVERTVHTPRPIPQREPHD